MTEEVQATEVAEQQVTPQEQPQEAQATPAEPTVDINWQKANQVLKLQQQKIAELEARLNERPATPPQPEVDEFANLDPDEALTVGQARQMAEKMAEKKAKEAARQMVQEYARTQRLETTEQVARSKYQDYDYVVENFAIPLIKNDPALAYKVQNSQNPAETAYRLGKLSDTYEEAVKEAPTSPKAEKILKNSQRPVSGNALGTPLKTQADKFASMKPGKEVWELSQQYAKGA